MRQADCARRTVVGKLEEKCHLVDMGIDERKILIFFKFIGVYVFAFVTQSQNLKRHYRIIIGRRKLVTQIFILVVIAMKQKKVVAKQLCPENREMFHPHVLVANISQKKYSI
jgi:hypothetical protein